MSLEVLAGRRLRVLLGMLGVDVHSRGLRTVARLLRDAGVEVVYLGEHNSAEGMVAAAVTEDVDAIGVSSASAATRTTWLS